MIKNLGGATGQIRQAYFVAAELGPWAFIGGRDGGEITASVRSSDAFRLGQAGLEVVVPFGSGSVRWPILALQITDGVLKATVGERSS